MSKINETGHPHYNRIGLLPSNLMHLIEHSYVRIVEETKTQYIICFIRVDIACKASC